MKAEERWEQLKMEKIIKKKSRGRKFYIFLPLTIRNAFKTVEV